VNPHVALPVDVRNDVALTYGHSIDEVSHDVLQRTLLVDELRRAFTSDAWQDGFDIACDVFDALARRQFQVYLGRFGTPPGSNFVERIEEELIDKLMAVLIESPLGPLGPAPAMSPGTSASAYDRGRVAHRWAGWRVEPTWTCDRSLFSVKHLVRD
jgi:hypothetical protein